MFTTSSRRASIASRWLASQAVTALESDEGIGPPGGWDRERRSSA